MTLLTIVQNACDEIGIQRPSNVIGNTNLQIRQLLALSNREGQSLSRRPYGGWEQLVQEATFTTVATESQGTIESLAPGYRYIINDTIINRTEQREIYGAIDPQDWQRFKAFPTTSPYTQYRIRGGELLFYPTPTAGDTCAFEYVTEQWCESSGGTGQNQWADDSDIGRLDEDLLTLGLIWRWQKAKKLEYAEDFAEYERRVSDAISRNGTKPTKNLNGRYRDRLPGVIVPQTGYGQ